MSKRANFITLLVFIHFSGNLYSCFYVNWLLARVLLIASTDALIYRQFDQWLGGES